MRGPRRAVCTNRRFRATPTAILKGLQEGRISGEDVTKSVITVAQVAEEQMGGTSGALYSCVMIVIHTGIRNMY